LKFADFLPESLQQKHPENPVHPVENLKMILFSTFLISTIITILLMPIFINLAYKANIMDIPDASRVT